MVRIIVCEKPSVAGDVAAALGTLESFERTSWGYKSENWWVCAAAGHLVEQVQPEEYDPKYKTWTYADLPIIPERYKYKPRDARGGQRLKEIAALIDDPRIDEIVNACDAGREGELIFALIYQYSKSTKPVLRAWFNSMTSNAIVAAFSGLKPGAAYAGLEAAARCRSEADWVVGMNATRAASTTLSGGKFLLSLGRVQTPTLALIVERDLSIERFVPEPYYQIRGDFVLESPGRRFSAWWRSAREGETTDRFVQKSTAEAIVKSVKLAGVGELETVETKVEQVQPPRLFDLTSLQREANKRHGMSAMRTLAAAQGLYETHKYLTYPRTDSQYITADMAAGVANLVRVVQNSSPDLVGAGQTILSALDTQRIVNDAKVTDHHAIIPTDGVHDLGKLSSDETNIYDLVVRRFLAALLSAQVLERTVAWVKVPTAVNTEWFRAAGRRELEPGWRVAWPESTKKGDVDDAESEDDGALCELRDGEPTNVQNAVVADKMTKAPARLNEASVLAAMETAGKFVDDETAAEAMKERGLGTPATRASIIETLLDREYVARDGRALVATDKGRGLIVALGEHPLTRPDLTGEWEQRLRGIERMVGPQATAGRREFGADVAKFARDVVDGFAGKTTADLQKGRRTLGPCPQSGCAGSIVVSKVAWGCTSWISKEDSGCGFVYWREQNGKKATEKQLRDFVERVRNGTVVVGSKRERTVLGICPRCGADVLEREKGWGCSSWKSKAESGCGYTIWKADPNGGAVDVERALQMLQSNTTNQKEKVVLCPCPRCEGEIAERPKFYGCDSWKGPRQKGCGILVWKLDKGVAKTVEAILTEIAAQGLEPGPAKKSGRKTKKRA